MPSSTGAAGPAGEAARVEVDLGALGRNYRLLERRVRPARILAVVKADAYGHGAVEVSRALAEAGVAWLGVGRCREGVALRRAGLETPILVLGTALPGELEELEAARLTPTISSREQLELWRSRPAERGRLGVHLKVDTGMRRLGVPLDELGEALAALRAAPGLELAGLLSHLAEADSPESPRNPAQVEAFDRAVGLLDDDERRRVILHLANSGGGLHLADSRRALVRFGLALYGLDPAADPARRDGGLEPAMSVKAPIALTREVETGDRVGYGGAWTAPGRRRLAVVPVGYGDGYPWALSGRGEILVGGRRFPVVGRVSMDMTIADVTGSGARAGDEAVLLGRQGGESITAWELAERAGTIPWETLCQFGLRLPRRHLASEEGSR